MAETEKTDQTESEKEVPDAVKDFELLLQDYGIKKAPIIAKNIAETGGSNVFDSPADMARRLAKWPREIAPVYRQSILEHWFKSRGVTVPQELLEEVGIPDGLREEKAKKKAQEKKMAEGAVWKVDIDDSGMPKIRMIKDESEPGITLSEAKTAAKEIGKEREEPIVSYDEAQAKHIPNFKSPFVRQNLAAAWATARQMDRAQAEGEAADPIDIWIDQQTKIAQLKEAMGVSTETKDKSTVGEIVSALKDLQDMAKEGKVGELPDWMTDPVKFIATVRTVSESGEAGGKPSWMTDPAEFIKMIRDIGGEGKGDDAVKSELSELRKTIEAMKEEKHNQEMAGLQGQIVSIQKTHEGQMKEILDKMEDLKKPTGGKTEMDIISDVASGVLGEAKGLRSDIKEVVREKGLPAAKTTEQREERKGKFRKALQTDQEIEEIGQRLFMGS